MLILIDTAPELSIINTKAVINNAGRLRDGYEDLSGAWHQLRALHDDD